ncbi:MAG TPA: NAD(P)-dependent oxidoreductase [Mycobacteriales bacterium]|nr:NAD(P)-dependent oxidoreductase [Mycobacteriales bacterium]
MRILLTGAGGNLARGIIPRLQAAGHSVVLSDLVPLPEEVPGAEFVQCDIQAGFGLERAMEGCDLLLHTPAWHGIHSRVKTEVDFWRLNVDGLFWALQAAESAGVGRLVFLSSMSWHGHYEKYGFTKRVGEELCEYHRRNHGLRNVIIRPHDFTPWGSEYLNRYGARLLYGGVDREDVLDCVDRSVEFLAGDAPSEPEGVVVNAVRPNAFSESDVDGWESDPVTASERIFPGFRDLLEKYDIDIARRPSVVDDLGGQEIGYRPNRHFGTFLQQLRELDAAGTVAGMRCPY